MTLVRIQIRRGTAQQWIDIDPILSLGEQGLETDTGREKVGNGADAWTALPYVTSFSTENINATDSTDNSVFFPVFVTDTGNNTPRIKKTLTAGSTVFSFNPSTSLLRVGGTVEAATFTGNSATTTRWLNDRTITIGLAGKTVNGTANVAWSLSEIGAAAIAQTMHIGTTAVNINRTSGNLALAGISSLALPGATSGTITLTPTAIAGTTTLTLPATTGTVALTSNIGNGTLTVSTSGVGLSSSGTFTANQSSNSTVTITSNATSSNTANTIVSRDGSGNFTAASVTLEGQLTLRATATTSTVTQIPVFTDNPASTSRLLVTRTPAQLRSDIGAAATNQTMHIGTTAVTINRASASQTLTGVSIDGNAATATALQTARTIGGVSFNGTANINLPGVNIAGNQNTTGTAGNVTGTVAVGNGGTGATSFTAGRILFGNGTSPVNSSSDLFWDNSNGRLGLGLTNPSERLHVSGQIIATNEITAFFSDERLKTKTGNIDNALDIVSKLSTFKYLPNELARAHGFDGKYIQLGLSAQEVEKVLPEVIRIAPFDQARDDDDNLISKSGENYLTLDYAKLVPVLIEAIKELEQKVNNLTIKLENN